MALMQRVACVEEWLHNLFVGAEAVARWKTPKICMKHTHWD